MQLSLKLRGTVWSTLDHPEAWRIKKPPLFRIFYTIRDKHGEYSLQHLAAAESSGRRLSDDEIMKEFISYDGVGTKTASCVLLFSLGRNFFAVDTQVFRLSKLGGSLKSQIVYLRRHTSTFASQKYDLHVLMIQHGRSCKGCKKSLARWTCSDADIFFLDTDGGMFICSFTRRCLSSSDK